MNRRSFAALAALGLLCAIAGAQNSKPSNTPAPENIEPLKAPSKIGADAKGPRVDPKSYSIGPEDRLANSGLARCRIKWRCGRPARRKKSPGRCSVTFKPAD